MHYELYVLLSLNNSPYICKAFYHLQSTFLFKNLIYYDPKRNLVRKVLSSFKNFIC